MQSPSTVGGGWDSHLRREGGYGVMAEKGRIEIGELTGRPVKQITIVPTCIGNLEIGVVYSAPTLPGSFAESPVAGK